MEHVPAASLGLRRAKLLEGLSPGRIDEVARACRWRRFAAGETLGRRGQADRDVYLIVAGKVRVTTYAASGRQVAMRDLSEGDSVGVVSAIDRSPRASDVIAITEVLAAVLSPGLFAQLLDTEACVGRNVMGNLGHLVRELTERVLELSTLGVQNRIHAELLRLANEVDAAEAGPQRLLRPAPRHADIAARVSTTREQVARELSALARSGLLEKRDNGLLVTDLPLLRRIVEEARRDL